MSTDSSTRLAFECILLTRARPRPRLRLFPLIGKYGMDYMYNACSTTARRGALDWAPKFYEANLPVFKSLYENVKNGNETRRSLQFNGQKDYREKFAEETAEIDAQEIWRAGKTGESRGRLAFVSPLRSMLTLQTSLFPRLAVRRLRPDYKEEL